MIETAALALATFFATIGPLDAAAVFSALTVGASILLMANQESNVVGQAIVIASLLVILLLTFVSLLLASKIQDLLGITGMHVITRVMGVLLSALAVQFIFDGIKQSGVFGAS